MIRAFLVSVFLLLSINSIIAQKGDSYYPGIKAKSAVEFKELHYNFGVMSEGSDVVHTFDFKNISKEEIHIREVTTSCGCTTPTYSNDPIKPHRKGKITAKYDSSRIGRYKKSLSVLLSDNETIELIIEGEIVKK